MCRTPAIRGTSMIHPSTISADYMLRLSVPAFVVAPPVDVHHPYCVWDPPAGEGRHGHLIRVCEGARNPARDVRRERVASSRV